MTRAKLGWVVTAVLTLSIGAGIWFTWRWIETTPRSSHQNDSAAADAHAKFGALYEAAWRGDDGIGEATMSATLLTPGLKTLMINDPQRGSLDTQVVDTFKAETKDQVAILIGLDAVAGSASARLPDAVVRDSLSFTIDETAAELANLIPLVVTDLPTTNTPTIQRRWVAFFTPVEPLNWGRATPMRATVKNIGGVPIRSFTWVNPALLNDAAS